MHCYTPLPLRTNKQRQWSPLRYLCIMQWAAKRYGRQPERWICRNDPTKYQVIEETAFHNYLRKPAKPA